MVMRYPYKKVIDLAPLISEEIDEAIEELGLRKDEDLTVMVEMGDDLQLVIQVGLSDKGIVQ